MKTFRNPEELHAPLAPYSHQVEVQGNYRWLTLSGQLGMRKDQSVPDDAFEQLKIALHNIKVNLEAANMEIEDITKLVFYIVGEMDADKRREEINTFLGGHLPCTTLLFVVALASPKFYVEIDAWACREVTTN